MQRLKASLGYAAAAVAVLAALLTPFVLIDLFTRAFAATGVRVDPMYAGGEVARTIDRGPYRITIHRVVAPGGPLQRGDAYVQLAWSPADALPEVVADEVDLDGDGALDLSVSFNVPRRPDAALRVDVVPRSPQFGELRHAGAKSFSSLIARIGDRIVVRVPVMR